MLCLPDRRALFFIVASTISNIGGWFIVGLLFFVLSSVAGKASQPSDLQQELCTQKQRERSTEEGVQEPERGLH